MGPFLKIKKPLDLGQIIIHKSVEIFTSIYGDSIV